MVGRNRQVKWLKTHEHEQINDSNKSSEDFTNYNKNDYPEFKRTFGKIAERLRFYKISDSINLYPSMQQPKIYLSAEITEADITIMPQDWMRKLNYDNCIPYRALDLYLSIMGEQDVLNAPSWLKQLLIEESKKTKNETKCEITETRSPIPNSNKIKSYVSVESCRPNLCVSAESCKINACISAESCESKTLKPNGSRKPHSRYSPKHRQNRYDLIKEEHDTKSEIIETRLPKTDIRNIKSWELCIRDKKRKIYSRVSDESYKFNTRVPDESCKSTSCVSAESLKSNEWVTFESGVSTTPRHSGSRTPPQRYSLKHLQKRDNSIKGGHDAKSEVIETRLPKTDIRNIKSWELCNQDKKREINSRVSDKPYKFYSRFSDEPCEFNTRVPMEPYKSTSSRSSESFKSDEWFTFESCETMNTKDSGSRTPHNRISIKYQQKHANILKGLINDKKPEVIDTGLSKTTIKKIKSCDSSILEETHTINSCSSAESYESIPLVPVESLKSTTPGHSGSRTPPQQYSLKHQRKHADLRKGRNDKKPEVIDTGLSKTTIKKIKSCDSSILEGKYTINSCISAESCKSNPRVSVESCEIMTPRHSGSRTPPQRYSLKHRQNHADLIKGRNDIKPEVIETGLSKTDVKKIKSCDFCILDEARESNSCVSAGPCKSNIPRHIGSGKPPPQCSTNLFDNKLLENLELMNNNFIQLKELLVNNTNNNYYINKTNQFNGISGRDITDNKICFNPNTKDQNKYYNFHFH